MEAEVTADKTSARVEIEEDTTIESVTIEETDHLEGNSYTRLENNKDCSTRLESNGNYSTRMENLGDSSIRLEEETIMEQESLETEIGDNKEVRPKRGSTITFLKAGESVEKTGKVKHVGKQGSKKRNSCWIECDDVLEELDFAKDIEGWKYESGVQRVMFKEADSIEHSRRLETSMEAEGVFYLTRKTEPIDVFAATIPASQYKHPEVQGAMADELEKWVTFDAYEIVNDDGQERIDTRWNILRKEGHDGLKTNVKARLCLRGFKELDRPRSDCPTVDRISNKILYTIAGNEGWGIECVDVTSAFLQGEDLNRDIYVTPPKEANMPGLLWRMKKAAYGLYDTSRRWWIKLIIVL